MIDKFKLPPKFPQQLTGTKELIKRLEILIGAQFVLTGKTRTDGSNIRKLIAKTLQEYKLPDVADTNEYEVIPPKGKGVPRIVREFIDTYVITTGSSYNLQVWNRMPGSNSILISYSNGETLRCKDIRYVFVRINPMKSIIESIIILTPDYIESKFGKFGKPTIKHQLLISPKARHEIIMREDSILALADSNKLSYSITNTFSAPKSDMIHEPIEKNVYSIPLLKELVAKKLIGKKLDAASTKNRGQALERLTLELLGYENSVNQLLYGGYPDIRNQLLEIKVQDSPTVDFGKYSPEYKDVVIESMNLTTYDVRYLIALTNPDTGIIEGIILLSGEKLGELFPFVSDQNYKCQRAIPMTFFDDHIGDVVFNPE